LAVEDVWTPTTDMPTARCMLGTCAMEGKIYAIAGQITHGPQDVGTAAVEVYDPGTDTWERKGYMPKIEAGLTAAVVDGNIYVIGGILDPRGT
jgi:N-acetylneuraminic acid mutarotase